MLFQNFSLLRAFSLGHPAHRSSYIARDSSWENLFAYQDVREFRIVFTANDKREIRVDVFLKKN